MTPSSRRTRVPPTPGRPGLLALGPVEQLRAGRLGRRLVQLLVGLLLYGASLAMLVRGTLGLAPWDVLHSGLVRHLPVTLGQMVVLASVVVLLLWIPLRERPGLGTLANAVLVGVALDLTLAVLAEPSSTAARIGLVVGAVLLNGVATALYIGAQLGPGPRDGLMTGLARRTGLSLRLVRTCLEVAVVVAGVLLGGTLGVATVLYALAIGPVAQAALPHVLVNLRPVGHPHGQSPEEA
ncbi:YczE/YyaS/YitT family protein [Nocardioides solisilvae]|uniref:membrane protein YczE n=1 Tax=Nocardioides solisilvae TaxID=1542435 RepID=UPI0019525C61|nr:hypothetical protein [Nocardioides solisilvae]